MILPPDPSRTPRPWGRDQTRLHRHLLRRPTLLPAGGSLLVAVSGGQDSMALTTLLLDLQPLHGWRLQLWHGDHGWRHESARQAADLARWARSQGLDLKLDRADPAPGSEAAAREWRYGCLAAAALQGGCTHVVTGHTASDRAETVLLNLARGSHLRGLASLGASRPLAPAAGPLRLARPLLILDRSDTGRLCRERGLPVWTDSSNGDLRFARNRLRADVMPVLEALHPGASRRISAQAERLEAQAEAEADLLDLALEGLQQGECPARLPRRRLAGLAPASQRRLLHHWLRRHLGREPGSGSLETLVDRLVRGGDTGRLDLPGGWQLHWDHSTLWVRSPDPLHGRDQRQ
ncbi:tRNA lysidine(34) synthetase TilS [Aphanothece minutissima]|uniref:tRNA(Ile)-lysidine synthase n=1 Tax=Aphanothece cf. minutissima CCALA 015 TaxID=2107695 RepID=A0ABX5F5F0_9CHRO|nr:tRNA lysidine(34) synthetase TilS [Aphanothece minutissima]PSB36692.1 tRNA lysidine(34) synthetase TilS [Aphanothece cf. minutissima CCALA 015]